MNEKLALSDDILMKIEKPARYIGGDPRRSARQRKQGFCARAGRKTAISL